MLRKCPGLLFLLSITFISTLVSPTSVPRSGSRRPDQASDENYENYYDETTTTETIREPSDSPPPHCKYDFCEDQQESCQKLALKLYCSCPGISGHFDPPEPPSLQSLSLETKGTVVVRWCAPTSTVTHYLISVGGQDDVREVRETRRMMELGDITPGTEVCVVAVNTAGVSKRESHSCARFEPSSSEARLAMRLGLIGAGLGVVIVVMLALLLWLCRRQHKTPTTRTATRGTDVVL